MNVQIHYLYRDAGNFKSYGSVVVANPDVLPAPIVEKQIRRFLVDGSYFIATNVSLPDLRFTTIFPHLDHDWHELEEVVDSDLPPDDSPGRTAQDMIDTFQVASSIFRHEIKQL